MARCEISTNAIRFRHNGRRTKSTEEVENL